jgi:hypothetical protein
MAAEKDVQAQVADDEPTFVTAYVEAWRGSYGFATIKTGPATGVQAICFKTINFVEVPLQTDFLCKISKGPKGWKVDALQQDALPDDIWNLEGVISAARRDGPMPYWRLIASKPPEGFGSAQLPPVTIFRNVLRQRGLFDIADGATVIVHASRKPRGYVATELLAPGPDAAFPNHGPHLVDGFALDAWDPSSEAKSVDIGIGFSGAPVVARVRLFRSVLLKAGIKEIIPGSLPAEGKAALLQAEILAAPKHHRPAIDYFLVDVEWEPGPNRWVVRKLLAPRTLRLSSEDERVDWVIGVVENAETDDDEADFGGPKPTAPREPTNPKDAPGPMIIGFEDSRVGRGQVRVYPDVPGFEHAACAPGVPVVVSLRGYKGGWTTHAIHRSTPGGMASGDS